MPIGILRAYTYIVIIIPQSTMNTRPIIEDSKGPVALSVSFNHDRSCFAVGLENGYCIIDSDPCAIRVARDFKAGIAFAEMLCRTNYIAMVGGGRNPMFNSNRVVIWDDGKNKPVIQLDFKTPVCGVRISRHRIAVALLESVHVFSFVMPPRKVATFETAPNPHGLCCLGAKILAFPGRTPGQVQVMQIENEQVSIIPAHASALRAIELSQDGEVLATASATGTLVRVFATSSCARIAELRRGIDPAKIFSISISSNSQLLAVTSDKSTLHIFDIPSTTRSPPRKSTDDSTRRLTSMGGGGAIPLPSSSPEDNKQKWGILSKIPLLPRVFSDAYSFASATFEMSESESTYDAYGTKEQGEERGRITKGIIGWSGDHSVVVISAGLDGKWEKFIIAEGEDGKRYCIRDGWKRYLGSG